MNRNHRIIWSESRNAFIVASEGAKAKGKPSSTRKAIAAAVLGALGALAAVPALAATSCLGGGTLTINAAETSQCNLTAGDSLTVTNSGSINAPTLGVLAGSAVTVGSISNSGSISSGNIGILLSGGGSVGSITNAGGTISGSSNGIRIRSGSSVGSITNNAGGTISGSNNGIQLINSSVSGSITNAVGTISGIRIRSGSSVGSITNNADGTISGSNNGIAITNASSVGSITNSGLISSTSASSAGYGIRLNNGSVSGSITNSGTISSNNTGIYLTNGSSVGSITNSGTISGNNTGIRLTSSSTVGSSIGSITNNAGGIISGNNTGILLASTSSTVGSITNSGTISGSTAAINVSASSSLGNLYIDGNNTASFVGLVNAANTAMSILSGATYTLKTADAFTVASFTNNGTAKFAAGVSSSFNLGNVTGNTFANNGLLEVGAGGTGTITGDYTQAASGTYRTNVTDDTTYGKLVVTGTATLPSNAKIDVNVATPSFAFTTASMTSIISAGTLVSDGTFTVTDNSVLFNFTASKNGNAVDLALVAASNSGTVNAVTGSGNTSGIGAATVLDTMITALASGGTGNADMDTVVGAFGALDTNQEISDAVAETLPLFTAGMNQVAINALHGTNRVIQARQDSNRGLSSGDEFLGNRKFWLKPVGSWTSQDNRKGVAGYDADTYGLVAGADGDINDSTRIGLALSYMHSDVDGNSTSSGNSADIDAYQAIVYGSHSLAAMDNTEINWQADLGTNKNKGRRAISFLNRVAKSDYDSLTAHAGVGIGRNYALNDKTTLTPALRADYTWIRDESYTETGAGALNLKVKGHSIDELILLVEGRLSHHLTDKATLLANMGVGYDVLNGENSVRSSYVGGGAAFSTQGLDASPWLARGGLGLALNATERTEVTARYDVEGRQDYVNQTASVKVRWAF